LGAELDELEDLGAYVLEVSSPGADAPLRFIRQYPKHVGREMKVKLTDSSEFKGVLEAVGTGTLSFAYTHKEKGKKAEQRTRTLPFEKVETAKVIISFK
jgi:ribosome maturation factor RimP